MAMAGLCFDAPKRQSAQFVILTTDADGACRTCITAARLFYRPAIGLSGYPVMLNRQKTVLFRHLPVILTPTAYIRMSAILKMIMPVWSPPIAEPNRPASRKQIYLANQIVAGLAYWPAITHQTGIKMPQHKGGRPAIGLPEKSKIIHFCMGRAVRQIFNRLTASIRARSFPATSRSADKIAGNC